MAKSETARSHRTHPILVVGGITMGILILFGVQFAVPYFLGPIGLVAVIVLDTILFVEMRYRRRGPKRQRRASRIVWGPVDRRYVSHAKHPLEGEVLATFVFVVFLVAVYAVGLAIRVDAIAISPNIDLFLVGSAMTAVSLGIIRNWTYASGSLESESERYDTTEDH